MLGDDLAFKELKEGKMRFTIGGKPQTPEDFQRQIVSRFGGRFDEVWKEAMRILQKEERSALLSQNRFYNEVYKPRRDSLVEKWSRLLEVQSASASGSGKKGRFQPKDRSNAHPVMEPRQRGSEPSPRRAVRALHSLY